MIDLHCHVLPGIDDGPPDMEGSLELCRAASADGIELIAATPHLRADHPRVVPGELAERCEQVNAALRSEGLPLQVVPGGEVDLLWAQSASDDDLRLVSLCQGGSYLLIETPYGQLGENFEDLLFQVQVRGYRVLLAHPERNETLRHDESRLAALVQRGVLVQITSPSLQPGVAAKPARKFALRLARHGLAHTVASDAHGVNGPRPVGLRQAAQALDQARTGLGRRMSRDVPAALIAGTPVPTQRPGGNGRRSLLRRRTRG